MLWIGIAAGIAAWLWWHLRPRPPVPAGGPADPHAGQVAEFRRAVADWSRYG
jgi:hypothetical protein